MHTILLIAAGILVAGFIILIIKKLIKTAVILALAAVILGALGVFL